MKNLRWSGVASTLAGQGLRVGLPEVTIYKMFTTFAHFAHFTFRLFFVFQLSYQSAGNTCEF